MRYALKTLLILLSWALLAVVVGVQVLPGKWLQQPLQLTKVARAAFVVPPKLAKLPKPKLLSRHDLIHTLQRAGWPQKLHGKAARIVFCESGNDAHIVGKKNPMDVGIFQINIDAHGGKIRGSTVAQKKKSLKDPNANARVALEVYRESKRSGKSGWRPWKSSIRCHGFV